MVRTAGRRAARVTAHSYPEALLRVGACADWFEVQIGQNFASARTADPDAGVGRTSGPQDLYLAAKFALTEQVGYLPETALALQATVPTGEREQTAGRVLPGLLYLYSWEVVPDLVSLGGSSVATGAVGDSGRYLLLAQSLSVGYTLTERLNSYTEFFALFPSGARSAGVGPQYFFNGGVLYRVTPNFQLDARAGLGLNRRADDFFAGVGFAVRF